MGDLGDAAVDGEACVENREADPSLAALAQDDIVMVRPPPSSHVILSPREGAKDLLFPWPA